MPGRHRERRSDDLPADTARRSLPLVVLLHRGVRRRVPARPRVTPFGDRRSVRERGKRDNHGGRTSATVADGDTSRTCLSTRPGHHRG
jgi:hypothetical protein